MYLIIHLPGQKNKYDSNIAKLAKRNWPHFLKYFTLDFKSQHFKELIFHSLST